LGNGFLGCGYLSAFNSWQASTHDSQAVHLLRSKSVHSCWLLDDGAAAAVSPDAATVQAAAALPLRNARLDIISGINPP